ncbi:MAG: ATP-binding cassette domain-containing protein [Candidatus Aenigmarchaeota archaeon]|nr:ATP-binding cassette domain-containing protein [Candidatus Aenigmarchaeota archaeon]
MKRKIGDVKAVDDVSFSIVEGETYGLVGESGSGKTTIGKTIVRIYSPTDGKIVFNEQDISQLKEKELKAFRRQMQMVFQDPTSSLNPRKRIKDIIKEPLISYKIGTRIERNMRVRELLDLVRLSPDFLYRYPFMLSGGEKQRIGIARAMALNPKFLVLDEPTSALDVSVQAKIISFMSRLQKELNLTYLFITHDLSLMRNIATRVGVMYLGNMVEVAPTKELYENPLHPYTKALISAIPVISEEEEILKPQKFPLEGEIPSPVNIPSGCPFHPRCRERFEKCPLVKPEMMEATKGHFVWCHFFS